MLTKSVKKPDINSRVRIPLNESLLYGTPDQEEKNMVNEQHLAALSNVPGIVLNYLIAPLQSVSLVCLADGKLMIGTSIVYPKSLAPREAPKVV